MKKKNCWEFKLCGRQLGGHKEKELGACSVSLQTKFNKVNGGVNAGRYCWKIPTSFCEFNYHGTFSQQKEICSNCDFRKFVQSQEGNDFVE